MTDCRFEFVNADELIVTGPVELQKWHEAHTLPVPGREHMPRFKAGHWDGLARPGVLRRKDSGFQLRCSRGLLERLQRDLSVQRASVYDDVKADAISRFCSTNSKFGTLRDYQARAIRLSLLAGWGRIAFATNAGKGAVIGLLARFARDNGFRALILCDELAVFDALKKEIATWGGFEAGEIKRGAQEPPTSRITLAMIPTLARRLDDPEWIEWLESVQMVLGDEADKANNNSWKGVLDAAKNSTWRLGFSGSFPTTLYGDLRFDELFGPVIDRVNNSEMVERGISARPRIEVRTFQATEYVQRLRGLKTFWTADASSRRRYVFDLVITMNKDRHEFIRSLIREGRPTAIIVNRIEHGLQLAETIPGSVFVDGSATDAQRIEQLEAFADGRFNVLVVSKILDRGTNRLGSATDIIFASGEGSTAQVLQRMGRGLRRTEGKGELRLVDIADRIALPPGEDKRILLASSFLTNALRKRLQVYNTEGFDVALHR